MKKEDRIVVGAIAGAFGVRGEVRVKSFCADPEAIANYLPLTATGGKVFQQMVITGRYPQGLTVRLDGVTSKEAADALRGQELMAERSALPSLPDDEFYHADLMGLIVQDTGGTRIGTVRAVMNHGAGDLIEVTRDGGKGSVLVPFTRAIVPTVDLKSGRIVIDPPEGLLTDG